MTPGKGYDSIVKSVGTTAYKYCHSVTEKIVKLNSVLAVNAKIQHRDGDPTARVYPYWYNGKMYKNFSYRVNYNYAD